MRGARQGRETARMISVHTLCIRDGPGAWACNAGHHGSRATGAGERTRSTALTAIGDVADAREVGHGREPVGEIPADQRNAEQRMAWYSNTYHCPDCQAVWDSEWSCGCDEPCPDCGVRNISPVSSEDRSVVVEPKQDGSWALWRSLCTADEAPAYELVGVLMSKDSDGFRFLNATRAK